MIGDNIYCSINSYRDYLRKNNKLFTLRKIYNSFRFSILKAIIIHRKHSKIAIIGCGRSGTKYVSKLFNSIGIKIGHERLEKNGIASWTLVPYTNVEVWGPSFYKIRAMGFPIVHQVRNPLKVISSVTTVFSDKKTWDFISEHIPIDNSETIIHKAMKYWYYWNLMAEKKAKYTYKVEDIEAHFNDLLRIGKFEVNTDISSIFTTVSTKVNSRKHNEISWNDLQKEDYELSQKIYELSSHYGYNVSDHRVENFRCGSRKGRAEYH